MARLSHSNIDQNDAALTSAIPALIAPNADWTSAAGNLLERIHEQ